MAVVNEVNILLQLLKRIDSLEDLISIQSHKGNCDASEYMRGLANGLILAQAVMTDTAPKFHEQPLTEES